MAPYRYNAPLPRKIQSPARKPYSPASKRSPFTSSRARNTARKTAGTPDYVFSRRDNYVAVSDRERHRERHPARPQSPDHRRLRFTRDSLLLDETETEEVEDDESEPMLFFWEDEKTLVSDMLHNGNPEEFEHEHMSSLAESIQDAFSNHSKELLDDIADTLVPAVNRVKHAHEVLNKEIDGTMKKGLEAFEEGCLKMEDATLGDYDKVVEAYCQAQERIKNLFKQLKEAYARRDQLWVDFEAALDETINPTIETLKNLPAELERTITNSEKQSKQLAQKDNGSTEKVLKGLLSKLV